MKNKNVMLILRAANIIMCLSVYFFNNSVNREITHGFPNPFFFSFFFLFKENQGTLLTILAKL